MCLKATESTAISQIFNLELSAVGDAYGWLRLRIFLSRLTIDHLKGSL
ncbi:hypothetical protein [Nostoc commune]|nr:hypothetical protein [Nostoc commune]